VFDWLKGAAAVVVVVVVIVASPGIMEEGGGESFFPKDYDVLAVRLYTRAHTEASS